MSATTTGSRLLKIWHRMAYILHEGICCRSGTCNKVGTCTDPNTSKDVRGFACSHLLQRAGLQTPAPSSAPGINLVYAAAPWQETDRLLAFDATSIRSRAAISAYPKRIQHVEFPRSCAAPPELAKGQAQSVMRKGHTSKKTICRNASNLNSCREEANLLTFFAELPFSSPFLALFSLLDQKKLYTST